MIGSYWPWLRKCQTVWKRYHTPLFIGNDPLQRAITGHSGLKCLTCMEWIYIWSGDRYGLKGRLDYMILLCWLCHVWFCHAWFFLFTLALQVMCDFSQAPLYMRKENCRKVILLFLYVSEKSLVVFSEYHNDCQCYSQYQTRHETPKGMSHARICRRKVSGTENTVSVFSLADLSILHFSLYYKYRKLWMENVHT